MEQKQHLTTTIIGLGLIGGTMAWALRDQGLTSYIIGVDNNEAHSKRALELGIIDELLPLDRAVKAADLVILAVPVTTAATLLPQILDMTDRQVITDVGSTKEAWCSQQRVIPKEAAMCLRTRCGGLNSVDRKQPAETCWKEWLISSVTKRTVIKMH
ncbi:prephenate dehydrogenase/arogenate dehydrogenase family protein [Arachidicoccus ginsenosidivorans]|uniref:prephenate dehydrogenase/arogenate dehydrogenase family protein n=1 Tax=Arachidicoccus ginsenosidivorans TaxID=496057 RepID=UPI0021CF880C|nr:prephenate dehydrogenase/arogenate dehydrogenase family protein [Arachidicoccus ginsenosidivorans]